MQITNYTAKFGRAAITRLLSFFCILLLTLSWTTPVNAQAGCTAGACFSAGPRLVSIDTTQSVLLNTLFQGLLPGTAVSLNAVDWTALSQSNINLNALITQLGTNLSLSDTTQILNAPITLGQLQLALVQVAQADGNTAAVNALNTLAVNIPGLVNTIRLIDVLKLSFPRGLLTNINLNLLDFVTGIVQLYNFRNVLTTPAPVTVNTAALGLAGVANLQLWLQVVEPPIYQCGGVGDGFHTGAIRVKINVDLLQGFNLAATIAAVNALPGIANVTLTQSTLHLQIYADIARAEGTISAINALTSSVTFSARPGVVNVYLGNVPDATFFNRSIVITDALFTPSQLTTMNLHLNSNIGLDLFDVTVPLTVTTRATATGSAALQLFTLSAPFPKPAVLTCGTACAGNLIVDLLNNIDLQVTSGPPVVTLLGIPVPLPSAALIAAINGAVNTIEGTLALAANAILSPVFNVLLSGLVDPLLGVLGIGIGKAIFNVEGVVQACASVLSLAKIVQPASDPGLFNLTISEGATLLASATNVGDGGTTGTVVTTPGTSYNLAETAGTATLLSSYNSTWVCTNQGGTQVSSGSGTSFILVAPVLSPTPASIVCRITNSTNQANLSISKSDGSATYLPGSSAVYVITVSNAGPASVTGAVVNDALPAGVTLSAPWTCSATGGNCSAASGGVIGGQLVTLNVDLGVGGQATINVPVNFSANPADY